MRRVKLLRKWYSLLFMLCVVLYAVFACSPLYAYSPDVIQQLGLKVKTIVIDAGHGGKDPGTHNGDILEKNIVLAFAKKLGTALEKQGFTVFYTRTSDVFIPLEQRTSFANKKKADIFLSIHCNANNPSISGLETYYLATTGSDDRARFVASRENAVSETKLNPLQIILGDFTLDAKQQESRTIAQLIQKEIIRSARKSKYSLKDNGVRSAPFYVLLGAKMPSILLELGYITNSNELQLLQNTAYQNTIIQGIVYALLSYKESLLKK